MSTIGFSRLGILTTIGPCRHSHVQAAILGRSLLLRFPDVPRAVVGRMADIRGLDHHGWRLLPSDDPRLRSGFESKLYMNEHTPFEETLFLDSDMLLGCDAEGSLHDFLGPLMACAAPVAHYANWRGPGESFQGTPITPLQVRAGIRGLYGNEAGGHYFWRKGAEADAVFALARKITAEKWPEIVRFNEALSGVARTSDEVAIAIAQALLVPDSPLPKGDAITTSYEIARYPRATFVHFLADLNPWLYHRMAAEVLGGHALPARATCRYVGKTIRRGVMRLVRGGWSLGHLRRLLTVDGHTGKTEQSG